MYILRAAVYDGMPYSKVKLAVISTMLIEDMVCAKVAEKGQLSFEAIADAAHSYAREVEHSDLNLQRLSIMFRHRKCFHTIACAVHYSNGRDAVKNLCTFVSQEIILSKS